MDDTIRRQAAIDALIAGEPYGIEYNINKIRELPSTQPEIVRCWECFYRRRCMLQHFVESNAVDGAKIDWSEWYCADGVRDISKSDERLEE